MSYELPIRSKEWDTARRSQRVLVRVPLAVHRRAQDGSSQSETTHTLSVNAHGALLVLAMDVGLGQTVVLKHGVTAKELEGRVVYVNKKEDKKAQIGITFARPAPNFWGLDFPPADWVQLADRNGSDSDWSSEAMRRYLSDD